MTGGGGHELPHVDQRCTADKKTPEETPSIHQSASLPFHFFHLFGQLTNSQIKLSHLASLARPLPLRLFGIPVKSAKTKQSKDSGFKALPPSAGS